MLAADSPFHFMVKLPALPRSSFFVWNAQGDSSGPFESPFHPSIPFPSFKVFVKQKSSEHTIKKAEQNHRSHRWVNFDYEALVLRQHCEKRRDPFPFPLAALGFPRVAVPCPHRPPLSTAWWQNNMRCPCSTRPARWLVRYLSEISIDIWDIAHMISFQLGMKIHESHWELHFRGVLVGLSCLG